VQWLLQWKSNNYYIFWVCVCSRRYSTCNVLPLYCHVGCLAVRYFSTLSHKLHYSWKKVMDHKMCVLNFSTTSVWNISHSKENWVRYAQKCTLVCFMLLLSDFNETWLFLTSFWKLLKYQISWKSIQWEQSCFCRWTDVMKLIVVFCKFAVVHKKLYRYVKTCHMFVVRSVRPVTRFVKSFYLRHIKRKSV
jgi:hypothetical protein